MKRGTPRHPKLLDLASRLKIPKYAAGGLLEFLWHFTSEYALPGDVGRFSDDAIAAALCWDGDSTVLVSCLIESRWLDACECHRLRVHDWPDHADQTVQRVLAKRHQGFLKCYDDPSTVLALSQQKLVSLKPLPLPLPIPIPQAEKKMDMYHKDSRTVLHLLNEASGSHFRECDSGLKFISARLSEPGVTLDNVKKMITRQCKQWIGTEMAKYLRPETLFNATKFEGYYAQCDLPIPERQYVKPVQDRNSNPRNAAMGGYSDEEQARLLAEVARREQLVKDRNAAAFPNRLAAEVAQAANPPPATPGDC